MKNFIMLSISIVLLLISGCCSQTNLKESKDFTEIIGDISVSKIEVVDGRTGKRHSITEKEKIKQFNQLLNEREYREFEEHEELKGYIYSATLYSDTKDVKITFLDDEIKIEDTYYSLNKPISEKDIANLLK